MPNVKGTLFGAGATGRACCASAGVSASPASASTATLVLKASFLTHRSIVAFKLSSLWFNFGILLQRHQRSARRPSTAQRLEQAAGRQKLVQPHLHQGDVRREE